MPTCELCDSTQPAGEACDVCGRPFRASEAAATPIPLLPELEDTRYSERRDVPVSTMPELEPTADRGGKAALPLEAVEGFSPTAVEPVDVDVEPLEVERVGDDAARDLPSAAAAAVSCRYCRRPAAPGERICASCGMRLPLTRSLSRAGEASVPCRDCGMPMTGSQCRACGARSSTAR